MALSGNQLRAARALVGIEQRELAKRSGVGVNTIRNMEAAGRERVQARSSTVDAVVDALKAAGVLLVDENGEGPGVRLRKVTR